MAYDYNQAINELKTYIGKFNQPYSSWYCGIAESPKDRLFSDHSVDEKNDIWIYRQCTSSKVAREVESYFVVKLGTKGDTGGGDDNTDYVYAYLITNHSKED